MAEVKKGCQTPTQAVTLPYEVTHGAEAVALYNETGRTAQQWQELLLYDILAENEDGLPKDVTRVNLAAKLSECVQKAPALP